MPDCHEPTTDAAPAGVPSTGSALELPVIGRRRFLAGVGAATAGVFLAGLPDGTAAAAVPAGASQFVPLPQVVRALDTRSPDDYEFSELSGHRVRVELAGRFGIEDDATAIVATLTAVNGSSANWVTIVPLGTSVADLLADNKLVSMLNLTSAGQASANLVQVRLAGGGVDIASRVACDVILDVIGFYRPVAGAVREGRFVGLSSAARAIDTRLTQGDVKSGDSLVVDVTKWVPASATSVVINLTATECTGPGYFTAYPYSSSKVPKASSLNVNAAGETRAAAVIVPVSNLAGDVRRIRVYARRAAKLIVDVTGYFTGPTNGLSENGLFVPVDPVRILDTREPGTIGRLWQGWTVEGKVPGAGATKGVSAVVNLTGTDSRGPGYLTIAPARRRLPGTSNLNFTGGLQVVPNHAITPITSSYGYQVFASGGAHVLVDYMGYYTGTPATATGQAPVNPDPPGIGPEWTLSIPSIGHVSRVLEGNGTIITNQGHSWHWEGTGFVGDDAHVASFAHRTTHGGIYRNIHLMAIGSTFTVTTLDRREYTYQVVRRDLTNGVPDNILAATRAHPGRTFSLIACSRTDFLPTNTAFRIVVTGVQVGWREL